jgi:hypothetical protein
MKLSITLSALLIIGFVAASTEQAGVVVYCQYVGYPAHCTVRAGVALRPLPAPWLPSASVLSERL